MHFVLEPKTESKVKYTEIKRKLGDFVHRRQLVEGSDGSIISLYAKRWHWDSLTGRRVSAYRDTDGTHTPVGMSTIVFDARNDREALGSAVDAMNTDGIDTVFRPRQTPAGPSSSESPNRTTARDWERLRMMTPGPTSRRHGRRHR